MFKVFMLRLSKKVEYAILALQYIVTNDKEKVPTKEISNQLNVSFEFLSKTMQALMKNGIVKSVQGVRGGYFLAKDPEHITVSEVIKALESDVAIVQCLKNGEIENCGRLEDCTIKNPMVKIQKKIDKIFEKTTIAALSLTNK